MDKWQAQYAFWSGFGLTAYEENSVPTGDNRPSFPYLTYQAVDAPFNEDTPVTASIWTQGYSWEQADQKANDILTALKNGGRIQPYDTGIIWVTADSVQSMGDPDNDFIKRKVVTVTLHFA